MKDLWRFFVSLFTDNDWDGDVTKVFGVVIVVVGLVGWLKGLNPDFVILFGSALAATGKFSKRG